MSNNIHLGPDAEANQIIRVLAAQNPTGGIPCEEPVAPGVQFSFDPNASFKGSLQDAEDAVLSFKVEQIEGSGWFALHVSLGGIDLTPYDVIGFVCKSDAPSALAIKACLRSGSEAGFSDCFFDKHIVAYGKTSTHLDAIDISQRPDLPQQADWRDFVLFFPHDKPLQVTLRDLRFFIV